MIDQVARLLVEHLWLVAVSTTTAVALGVPLGVLAAHRPGPGRVILAVTGALQVVPSLALFGLLLPLPVVGGIGARTAIVALVLYALLPIVRSTAAGIEGIDPSVREAALAMGMTSRQRLIQVELPLALGVIAAGVRVATVIGVGVATIAAAVGAGGLGTIIFRGLRMNDSRLVLWGALPAAALALGLDLVLGLLGRRLGAPRRGRESVVPRLGQVALVAVALAAVLVLVVVVLRAPPGGGASGAPDRPRVTLGSKDFTEQVLLGEILALGLEARGVEVARRFELGGTLCHEALLAGSIDAYPEYTGTAWTALLRRPPLKDPAEVLQRVRAEYRDRFDVVVGEPLGFANDFAILVRGEDAARLGLRSVSDLARVAPELRAGFGQDFMSRPDGYAGFVAAYGLRFRDPPREMDLSLTYRALAGGEVDLIAGNSTDGLIGALHLQPLTDDRRYFPPYQAVWLARRDALDRVPALAQELAALVGAISTEEMRCLNLECDGRKRAPAEVAQWWRERRRSGEGCQGRR